MSNRVLTGMVAAATASLLLGGGIARAAGLGLVPAPPAGAPIQAEAAPSAWVAVPVDPAPPALRQAPAAVGALIDHRPQPPVGVAAPKAPTARHSTPNDTVVTPAPPSSATADVLRVNPLDTCVSCTSARAGSGTASAHATAIRLLGNNISAGEGSSTSKNSGALLAVPLNPLLTLAVADWEESTAAGATSTSHSRAALVDLAIGPNDTKAHDKKASGGAITVAVLEATSDAGYQGLSSNGAGSNNGVDVNIGQGALVIILLHSDASSSNKGSAYVLGINGTQLLSSDQTGGGGVPISVPGVVGIVLLQVGAIGGNGSNGGAAGNGAAVGTVSDLLGQAGQAAGLLTASAVGLTVTPATGTGTAVATPTTGTALTAPSTGIALGAAGLVILPAGLALLFLSLRRRRGAAG